MHEPQNDTQICYLQKETQGSVANYTVVQQFANQRQCHTSSDVHLHAEDMESNCICNVRGSLCSSLAFLAGHILAMNQNHLRPLCTCSGVCHPPCMLQVLSPPIRTSTQQDVIEYSGSFAMLSVTILLQTWYGSTADHDSCSNC